MRQTPCCRTTRACGTFHVRCSSVLEKKKKKQITRPHSEGAQQLRQAGSFYSLLFFGLQSELRRVLGGNLVHAFLNAPNFALLKRTCTSRSSTVTVACANTLPRNLCCTTGEKRRTCSRCSAFSYKSCCPSGHPRTLCPQHSSSTATSK